MGYKQILYLCPVSIHQLAVILPEVKLKIEYFLSWSQLTNEGAYVEGTEYSHHFKSVGIVTTPRELNLIINFHKLKVRAFHFWAPGLKLENMGDYGLWIEVEADHLSLYPRIRKLVEHWEKRARPNHLFRITEDGQLQSTKKITDIEIAPWYILWRMDVEQNIPFSIYRTTI